MTDLHPILSLPSELVEKWANMLAFNSDEKTFTEIAQWGADQELEACVEWIYQHFQCGLEWSKDLRAARRPKPPTLKEQALEALNQADEGLNESEWQQRSDTIRRALEALPND